MAGKLQGITLEIGGDTKKLNDALRDTNKEISSTQKELGQVEKLLKLDPKNTELLTQKQELLGKEIGSVKDKLDKLKEAEKQAKASGLTNTEDGQKAYRELQREIIQTEQSLKGLEEQNKKVNISFDSLKSIGKGVADGMVALGTTAIATATAIGGLALKSGAYADDINTLATKTGIATDQLQIFQRASDLLDVDVNTIAGSMKKLTANMSSASKGTGTQAEAFAKLGVSVTDANGELRNNNDVFSETIKALGQIENETERDATAMKLFGKSATELNPLIEGGIDDLNSYASEWQKLGIILDQDTLDGANAFNDQIDRLKANTSGVFNALGSEIASSLVPQLTSVNDVLVDVLGNLLSSFREGGIEGLIDEVGNVLSMILDKIVEFLPNVIQMGVTLIQSLIQGLQNNIGGIVDATISIVKELTNGLIALLPQLITLGATLLLELCKGLAEAIPELIPTIIEAIGTITTTLIENLPLLIEAGMQLLFGVAKGLIDAIPDLIEQIPTIIDSLTTTLIDNLPLLVETGFELLVALIGGLIEAIPDLVKAIPKILDSLNKALLKGVKKMGEIGLELVKGLFNGIQNATSWLWEKITGWVDDVMDFIKGLFGIHSPSRVMRDEVGKYLAQGIGVGFEQELPSVIDDMAVACREITDAISTELDVNAMPNINKAITQQNYYTTKSYQNTTEIVRQPSEVIMQIDKTQFGRVVVPAYNQQSKIMGAKLSW